MTKPYPNEFRDDVVRVARNREPSRREGWLNSEAPQWENDFEASTELRRPRRMLLAPEEVDAVRIANDIVQSGGEDGPGMAVTIHTSGVPDHGRERVLRGSGIIRTARVFADHTTAGVFGTKDGTY